MTKKHQADLTAVAEKIYDLAELEDFHVIADTASSYLMGNAMAMVEESCWNDDLKTLNTHVRQIATYVASNQRAELGPKS